MNRLFIIGNGFDIAHSLKTKYCDFINDFWRNIELKPYHCLIYLNPQDKMLDLDKQKIKCYVTFKEELISLGNKNYQVIDKGNEHLFIKGSIGTTELFKFKNDFFKTITLKNGIQNWVDIEREYYHQLKEIVKNDSLVEQKYEQVKMLNDELEQIKKLFEKYLDEKVNTSINNKTITDIKEILKVSRWKFNTDLDDYKLEFSKDDYTELEEENAKKKGLFYGEIANQVHDKKINEVTLILNFNYTSLIDTYLNERELSFFEHIQIHGKVNGSTNKINFGFGDEMDEDYRMIENLNENEFLRNFKSFGYSQNSNYKKLLDFIDSGKFQVIIMGHSCGISDRTMLNTIFEHHYCSSIKVFYHQWKDDEGFIHDNYTELVQNISRHFNKKKLMREKVVNKSLCKPLIPVK